jgi:hypothetical protein
VRCEAVVPRGPINREHYRVLSTLDDGGLVVAPITGRRDGHDGTEQHGAAMTLPTEYVAQHVALGYASTVHAAQGLTVATSHTVATNSTGVEALYVGMTRGRHLNTAHVVTRAVPDTAGGAPTGQALQAVHRSPQAVLAAAFESTDPQLSALAAAAQSEAEAGSVRTPAELFADAAELATAGRTAAWLDELVAHGHLTDARRAVIAAEDGAATLTTLLRRVELAGQDPHQVLTEAVTSRSLHDARQLTNVLHRRITNTTRLDPIGDTYTDRMPQVDDPQWAGYLATLAQAADERQAELGAQVAEQAPQWAVEALGPVPTDETGRDNWQHQAAAAAAYRELVGFDDPTEALGPAPKQGQVEAYASWRAAWRALGRPQADRAEAEMSTGQLRLRIRAYDREQTWAPPYVANELAGTRQAARRHRHDATMRAAEADTTANNAERDQRVNEARQAAALADALDARVTDLEAVDDTRAHWYAHTAQTRAAADRATAELSARQADPRAADDRQVSPDEWLNQHQAALAAEDPHRVITGEHELTDIAETREHDQRTATPANQTADHLLDKTPASAPDQTTASATDLVDESTEERDQRTEPHADSGNKHETATAYASRGG